MYKEINLQYESLEPYISDRTLSIHYNNHYLNYLKKLNQKLDSLNYDYRYTKEELFKHIDIFNIKDRDEVLYNLGGAVNHELYFSILGGNNIPVGKFKEDIIKKYGSFDNFITEFKNKANNLVGSGYTFLVLDKEKKFNIINLSNQESPYLYNMIPIIALDLWEHAYYLDYQNNKKEYIDIFFKIIDYNKVNKIYEEKNKSI